MSRIEKAFAVTYELANPDDFDTWFVYVFKAGPYYKIGVSVAPSERRKALQIGSPLKVALAMRRPVSKVFAYRYERAVHHQLRHARHRGEWFLTDATTIKRTLKAVNKEYEGWRAAYLKLIERREYVGDFDGEILSYVEKPCDAPKPLTDITNDPP